MTIVHLPGQVPYREHQEEANDGDPYASYSYICADAAAKARGTELGAEVAASRELHT